MQDYDSVIKELIETKVISLEDGLNFASNQNNLLLSLKGLTSAEEFIRRDEEHATVAARTDSGSMLGMLDR
jgi:Tfp pilus assembly ATPase PilU